MKLTALLFSTLIIAGLTNPACADAGSVSITNDEVSVEGSAPPGGASEPYPGEEAPPANDCNYQYLIGKKSDSIDKSSFGDHFVRVLNPGQMISQEYMYGRINLHVDDSGTVINVTCG